MVTASEPLIASKLLTMLIMAIVIKVWGNWQVSVPPLWVRTLLSAVLTTTLVT